MRDERIGRALWATRIRQGLRQEDLAAAAGLSQSVISRIERGQLGRVPIGSLRAAFEALGGAIALTPVWRGASLDRLLDERHAVLSGIVLRLLSDAGWEVASEVTFSHFGERGSVDLLGGHHQTRTVLVTEIKTELGSLEETQRQIDVKVRLAGQLGLDRFGWRPTSRARLLVLPEGKATRHQLERHADLLGAAFPDRGWAVRRWLRTPSGPLAGLWILSSSHRAGTTRISPLPQRVRRTDPSSPPGRKRSNQPSAEAERRAPAA